MYLRKVKKLNAWLLKTKMILKINEYVFPPATHLPSTMQL